MGKDIENLLQQELIKTSNSPWAAPVDGARRKNGKLCLAFDFCALNAQSLPTTLLRIPHMDDLLDILGYARIFSTMDWKSGYHQIPLRKKDRKMIALNSSLGAIPVKTRMSFCAFWRTLFFPTYDVSYIRRLLVSKSSYVLS